MLTRTWNVLAARLALVIMAGAAFLVTAAETPCFLQDGDVWVFEGDSITHADTYRRLCERLFRHYHPEAKVEFVQAAVWGSTSSDVVKRLKGEGRKASVASLMLGMNNAINGGWVKGKAREPFIESYRKDVTAFVHKYKADGAAVILMSPTFVDETTRHTVFRLDGTNDFLRDCQRVVKEVAAAEGAVFLPVQEEFEAFQASLGTEQKLRPDGVHPASLGEYQIARTLWERLGFAGPLAKGPRLLSEPAPALPVSLKLNSHFLDPGPKELVLALAGVGGAPVPAGLVATWSLGEQRGTAEIAATATAWTLAPPNGLPALKHGEATELVVSLRAGERAALAVVDLCAVPVLHFKDNVISGTIASTADRPEGRKVATWTLTRSDTDLLLDVDVTDDVIDATSVWAWGRDGLNMFWDLRPTERFGDINLDTEFHQSFVNVYDKPFFAAALRPGLGTGMELASTASGERTATGYRARFRLHESFGLHRPWALAKRDFIGLALIVVDADPGRPTGYHEPTPTQRAHDQYGNNLPILDLKDKLKSDSVLNLHLFPPPPPVPAGK